jgi:hypothetical protein
MTTSRCPKCGSTGVRQITPGLFECINRLVVGAIPPRSPGNVGLVPIPVERECGTRFQVASEIPVALCACGRQSIGNCTACGRPLCGLHGSAAGAFVCTECGASRNAGEERARVEARQKATREHEDLLTSEDPTAIAQAASETLRSNSLDLPAKAWRDYLRLASPSPTDELVTLSSATRWRNPVELERSPLWRYTHVKAYHAHGHPPPSRVYFLDAEGNYAPSLGRARPVAGRCVIPAGTPARVRRYMRGPDPSFRHSKVWRVEVEGGLHVADRRPAPGLLLASAICEYTGLAVPGDNEIAWSGI